MKYDDRLYIYKYIYCMADDGRLSLKDFLFFCILLEYDPRPNMHV